MKHCPSCGSKKWRVYRGRGHCENCGKVWISSAIQETDNDGVIIESDKPSYTINSSSSDCQLSSRDISKDKMFDEMHDEHNPALKFKITRDNPNLDLEKQNGFKGGWFVIPHELKVRKSKNILKIYKGGRNKVPLRDLDKTDTTITQGIINVAKEIANKLDFEIDSTPIFTKINPEIKTPFLSAVNFVEPKAKAVYKLPSPIELQGEDAPKNAWNLTYALVTLQNEINRLSNELSIHSEVERRANEFLEKANERLTLDTENFTAHPLESDKFDGEKLSEISLLKPLENLLNSSIRLKEAMLNA